MGLRSRATSSRGDCDPGSTSRACSTAHDLTRAEAREAMHEIMSGEATQAQIAGFLVALRAKGETADEIAGCAEAMREHVLPVHPKRTDLVDTAGTGGDGDAARSTSRPPRRSSRRRREPALRSTATAPLVADRLGRRARGARLQPRARAGARSHARSTSSASASCSRRRTTRRCATRRRSGASSRRVPCSTCSAR